MEKLVSGVPATRIANEFGTSQNIVLIIKRKFEGAGSVGRAPGTGRPSKTTERQGRWIIRAVKLNHDITAEDMKEELGIKAISERAN